MTTLAPMMLGGANGTLNVLSNVGTSNNLNSKMNANNNTNTNMNTNSNMGMRMVKTEAQRRVDALTSAVTALQAANVESRRYCDRLLHRSRILDSLTSPANDASRRLTQASQNLQTTSARMKDAREKFDTVNDCEPSIKRLHHGSTQALRSLAVTNEHNNNTTNTTNNNNNNSNGNNNSSSNGSSDGKEDNGDGENKEDIGSTTNKTKGGKDGSKTIKIKSALSAMSADMKKSPMSPSSTSSKAMANKAGEGSGAMGGGGGGGTVGSSAVTVPYHYNLSEQDVYSAADSMDIVRDAYSYFVQRQGWKSTPSAMGGLERVHRLGVEAMCNLVRYHLTTAGPAVVPKKRAFLESNDPKTKSKVNAAFLSTSQDETAVETRKRIELALRNKQLMKALGDYEECLPLQTRPVRELRAIAECLADDASELMRATTSSPRNNNSNNDSLTSSVVKTSSLPSNLDVPNHSLVRTERIGSGFFTELARRKENTGYPHLDAYAEVRRKVAYDSVHNFYRTLKEERRKKHTRKRLVADGIPGTSRIETNSSDVDSAARDAIRCLEHAIVVVAGEKGIYRCVMSRPKHSTVSSTLTNTTTTSTTTTLPQNERPYSDRYRDALASAYTHVASGVVDRTLDIIETVFQKEAGKANNANVLDVRVAASGAAGGLRILDGVRMLGPTLAKLCDVTGELGSTSNRGGATDHPPTAPTPAPPRETLATSLCIGIHRSTVRNTARQLETLAKAVADDPVDERPADARVATVSSDVFWAIGLLSPFVNAYNSVAKRKKLTWDSHIGAEAKDMDAFVRYLIDKLLANLQSKSVTYQRDLNDPAGRAKTHLFLMNNTFYLLDNRAKLVSKATEKSDLDDEEHYKLTADWFHKKVQHLFEKSKALYLKEWETALKPHLKDDIDLNTLSYQKGDKLLSLESGRLLKHKFSGFNEAFESLNRIHRPLMVVNHQLRTQLQEDVTAVFFDAYEAFYKKYSALQFSKKKMAEYLKYPPERVKTMLAELYHHTL